ncbi:hypothetical protein DB347_22230 [Opitutaceae bacterium EW11]|nr:hypothetical protein DB347_22230 [Opitutaceae bacterium EW11]
MKTITKDQFLTVLDDAGVTEEQRKKLHASFERRFPEAHQAFLEFLGFPPDKVKAIREQSRS